MGGFEDMISLALTLASDKGQGLGLGLGLAQRASHQAQGLGLDYTTSTLPATSTSHNFDPLGSLLSRSGVELSWLVEHVVEILDGLAGADFMPGNTPYQH